jgi:hypothetical protein
MWTHSCAKEYVRKAQAVLFSPKIIRAESRLTENRRTRSADVAGERGAVLDVGSSPERKVIKGRIRIYQD